MKRKIVTAAAAGAVVLAGATAAGPALAATRPHARPTAVARTTAVTQRVDRLGQVLANLVTAGTITQAQADSITAAMKAAGTGTSTRPQRGTSDPDLSVAATALGMSVADVQAGLQKGESLAQIAGTDKVDALITALVTAGKTRIAQEVTDGRLTQAQADKLEVTLQDRVTKRVNAVPTTRHKKGGSTTTTSSGTA